MSRWGSIASGAIATVFGIATAFATFQQPLKEEAEARAAGRDPHAIFSEQHPVEAATQQQEKDSQISSAIFSDIKEAGREVDKAGFAWGIREAIWGPGEYSPNRRSRFGGVKGQDGEVKGGAAKDAAAREG